MVKTQEAIEYARSLLGTPYSELDCINLIKAIIRNAPGGVKNYTDAHVPALWDSYNSSAKYQHLIWRAENIDDPLPGQLIFKGKPLGRDHQPSHVGLVTGPNTVIHSSSSHGCVVETEIKGGEWTLLGQSKYIEVGGPVKPDEEGSDDPVVVEKQCRVYAEEGDTVNLRVKPMASGPIRARIPIGTIVTVTGEDENWAAVSYKNLTGYMMKQFLEPADKPAPSPDTAWHENVTMVSEEGSMISLQGRWRVAID